MTSNIERHPTILGCWIAYDGHGEAFRIFRANPGYAARPSHLAASSDRRRFRGDRLKDVAATIGASTR